MADLARSPVCRYFLARAAGPMAVELVDDCHDSPEGVAQAAKLHARIFDDEGPWVMVEVHDLPAIDVPINEAAAADAAYLVAEGDLRPACEEEA